MYVKVKTIVNEKEQYKSVIIIILTYILSHLHFIYVESEAQ